MISNNGADIFRYWGEAHVSGSADSGTCSSGMERLFAFPLLSVKEKTDLERAGLDRYKKRGRERDLWTRSENEIDRDPESRPSNLFFLLLQEDFSPSFVSILARINLPSDRSIDLEMSNTNIHIFIYTYRVVWDGNSIRMEGKPGAELPGSRGAL